MGLTEKHWFEDDYVEVRRGDLEQLQNEAYMAKIQKDEPIYAVNLFGDHFFKSYYIRGKENAIRFMKQNVYSNSLLNIYYARLYETCFDELGMLTDAGDPILVVAKEGSE